LELENCFRDDYHYNTIRIELPTQKDSPTGPLVRNRTAEQVLFEACGLLARRFDEKDDLIIIHYRGDSFCDTDDYEYGEELFLKSGLYDDEYNDHEQNTNTRCRF